ncbi:MAG: ABC transporter permease, partial [Gemmatimonadaceae bacterium]
MTPARSPRRRLFRFPWRNAKQIRADIETEFRFHLDMRVDELVALGMLRDEAAAKALREFGDLDDARRYVGAVDQDIEAAQRRSERMSDLWQDLRYSVRQLRAAPAFTLAAIATLALGIGANTAIFSVVNAALLQPLPFPHQERLVRVLFTQQGHPDVSTPLDVFDYAKQSNDFTGFSTLERSTANLSRDGADAERIPAVRVGANFFSLLGVKPLTGRFFTEGEDQAAAANVAVISEQLWRRDFGADSSVVGKLVRINSAPYTIVGVVRAGERYPLTTELWMTKQFTARELDDQSRGARWLGLLARVKNDVDITAANEEVQRISVAMEHRFPEQYRDRRARIASVQEFVTGSVRQPLYIVLGAVALVLLIACA